METSSHPSLQILSTESSSILVHQSLVLLVTQLVELPYRFSAAPDLPLLHHPSVPPSTHQVELLYRSSAAPDLPLLHHPSVPPSSHLVEPLYRSSLLDHPLFYYTTLSAPQYSPGGASLQVLSTRSSSILLKSSNLSMGKKCCSSGSLAMVLSSEISSSLSSGFSTFCPTPVSEPSTTINYRYTALITELRASLPPASTLFCGREGQWLYSQPMGIFPYNRNQTNLNLAQLWNIGSRL